MANSPVRALLQLDYVRPGWHRGKRNAPLLAGLVVPGETCWALPPLDEARIIKIRGPNLLIQGIEEIQHDRRTVTTYRQAWWCRLVIGNVTPVIAARREVPAKLTSI